MPEQKAQAPAPDWERIGIDYRAGILSVREIAAAHGVSHTAIQKRAKAHGWERDLKAKIQAKADALVAKREVASKVATVDAATEKGIIEGVATAVADIRMSHRTDIQRSRRLANSLLDELEGLSDNRELFAQLGELLTDPEADRDTLSELYHKVIALPGRSKVLKEMSDTLKTLVALERQAYSMDEQQHDEPYEARLKRLMGEG